MTQHEAQRAEFRFHYYRATHQQMGSLEFSIESRDFEDADERGALVHAAWCAMWKQPGAAKMLHSVCAKLGVAKAKQMFGARVEFERLVK